MMMGDFYWRARWNVLESRKIMEDRQVRRVERRRVAGKKGMDFILVILFRYFIFVHTLYNCVKYY